MSAENRLTSIVSYPERGTGGNNRYRGNCSPKLIEDLIGFFRPAEICDYMCGSGTTQDAAHTMGIISHCYDLHSGFDLINCEIPERPEFVFWHPPYWDMITFSDVMYKASEVQSAIAKGVEDAKKNGGGDFPTITAGKYEVKLESMEIKGTKADPNRPMLAVSFKILSGEFKNQRLFMNRVLYGTKNDKNMIASAMGFLEKLDSGVPVSFTSYKQFSQLVLDVAEAIDGNLEYAVDYDDSRFNSITVEEVFEVEN